VYICYNFILDFLEYSEIFQKIKPITKCKTTIGANLSGMVEAAEKLVSEAKGVRSDMTSLSKIPKHATTLIIDL